MDYKDFGYDDMIEFLTECIKEYVDTHMCGYCGKPIKKDDDIFIWKDGKKWHLDCVNKLYEGY